MLWTAFFLGLTGSLHCVGMCGPIAAALPYPHEKKRTLLFQTLSYNAGRTFTYALQGGLLGFLGRGLAWAGLQQGLSVFIGLTFIGFAVSPYAFKSAGLGRPFFQAWTTKIRSLFASAIRGRATHFWMGCLNGLLPCGLVYGALAASVLTTGSVEGAAFMALFGLGTTPLMALAVMGSRLANRRAVAAFYRLIPVYQFLLGVFLIGRGFAIDAAGFWELRIVPMCH